MSNYKYSTLIKTYNFYPDTVNRVTRSACGGTRVRENFVQPDEGGYYPTSAPCVSSVSKPSLCPCWGINCEQGWACLDPGPGDNSTGTGRCVFPPICQPNGASMKYGTCDAKTWQSNACCSGWCVPANSQYNSNKDGLGQCTLSP